MVSLADVRSDESLLTVPGVRALQVTTGCESPASEIDNASWRRLEWWAQLASLLLLEVDRGNTSALAPWVETLPSEFPSVPLGWREDELALLAYPPLVERVKLQQAEVAQAYEEASTGCSFDFSEDRFQWAVQVVRSRTFSGPYEGRGAQERVAQVGLTAALLTCGVASGVVSPENGVRGAALALLAIPLTDILVGQTAGLRRHVLCPVIDYLNHDSAVSSDIAYEYFGDAFAVRVRGGARRGDEVRINYGDRRGNDELLQYYGFVESDCPHDAYELDLLAHLDDEAAAAGTTVPARLTRTGPDAAALEALRKLLSDGEALGSDAARPDGGGGDSGSRQEATEALVWRAVALACEAELQSLRHRAAAAVAAASGTSGPQAEVAAQFQAEKEKVLVACRGYAEARGGRLASSAPLSLLTRAPVVPVFEDTSLYRHPWADGALTAAHVAALRRDGFCLLPVAFEADLARRCRGECEELDARRLTTVTTNACNTGSRSTWLEFGGASSDAGAGASVEAGESEAAAAEWPALRTLSKMLAGLPGRVVELALDASIDDLAGAPLPPLRVHAATMLAVYPAGGAAKYSLHKDSYAPADPNPATGGTRTLTILAYLNEWQEGDGGELRLHEADNDLPDGRRFKAVPPVGGSIVMFDSSRVWHSVAPSLGKPRWAVTLWVH